MRWKFAVAVLLLSASPLFAKSLNWAEVIVNARLDSDGRMHIQERQAITFDGDWNGGERTFNVPRGQRLDFRSIGRVENGHETPLLRGDLSQVDHWDFSGANVVRWRSRLPSDPPFQNRTIVYVLDYVLSGVLDRTSDGHYHLHHDFSFPDRAGTVGYFGLTFTIDPAWSGLESPLRLVRRDLAPGQTVFVDSDLTYGGATKPADVHIAPTLADKLIFPIFIAIAGILLTVYFYSAEARKGLFAPLMTLSAIDEQWLQKNVFLLPPEAVGAAWDETIGSHEVAAVIARMAQEKKLTTWVTPGEGLAKKPVLNMKLEVDWRTLPPDEQHLVEALFLGNVQTDTAMIQQHYRSTGFQPQKLIHDSINAALDTIPVWRQSAKAVSNGEILTAAFALFSAVLAFLTVGNGLQVFVFFGGMATIFGLLGAVFVRRSAQGKVTTISIALSWLVMLLFALASFFAAVYEVPAFGGFAAAAGIGFGALILLVSRSRDSVAKLAFRRRLAAARAFFQAQLRQAKPNLRDSWYPYLVALGLGPDVDQWFHAFPDHAVGPTAFGGRSSGDFASSSSSSSGGWTGGGGAFGGAGASGAWAAMSAVAGGVATPGSSGGGGGGGGSGGGGGGGW